jgi:hypothetical protein
MAMEIIMVPKKKPQSKYIIPLGEKAILLSGE